MTKIKILGVDVSVRFSPDISQQGLADIWKSQITINPDQGVQEQRATLIHEIIEMINAKCDLSLSHQTISTLESALSGVIFDNEHIFQMFFPSAVQLVIEEVKENHGLITNGDFEPWQHPESLER